MGKFIKKQQSSAGTNFAIMQDRKATYAVCEQDGTGYNWRYVRRFLPLDRAESLLEAYTL